MRFRSLKKGDGKLTLINVRPWEQPEYPQETFMLNITVEKRIRPLKQSLPGAQTDASASSRKGGALSRNELKRQLFAIPARASLGRDDEREACGFLAEFALGGARLRGFERCEGSPRVARHIGELRVVCQDFDLTEHV